MFICLSNMNPPVFPSLDDIYCNGRGAVLLKDVANLRDLRV